MMAIAFPSASLNWYIVMPRSDENKSPPGFKELCLWMNRIIVNLPISFERLALFGSYLSSPQSCRDIDLLLVYHSPDNRSELKRAAESLLVLRRCFFDSFHYRLHVTAIRSHDHALLANFLTKVGDVVDILLEGDADG
jgi:hypothetical protein